MTSGHGSLLFPGGHRSRARRGRQLHDMVGRDARLVTVADSLAVATLQLVLHWMAEFSGRLLYIPLHTYIDQKGNYSTQKDSCSAQKTTAHVETPSTSQTPPSYRPTVPVLMGTTPDPALPMVTTLEKTPRSRAVPQLRYVAICYCLNYGWQSHQTRLL